MHCFRNNYLRTLRTLITSQLNKRHLIAASPRIQRTWSRLQNEIAALAEKFDVYSVIRNTCLRSICRAHKTCSHIITVHVTRTPRSSSLSSKLRPSTPSSMQWPHAIVSNRILSHIMPQFTASFPIYFTITFVHPWLP
jgi:hypothetical protein